MGDSRNKSNRRSQSNRNSLSKVDTGTISEHDAIKLLIKEGFYVARSCHTHSPFDIVAIDKNGLCYLIDVKTKAYRTKSNNKICRSPNKIQRKLGVQLMIIDQKKNIDKEEQKEFFYKLEDMLNYFPSKKAFNNYTEDKHERKIIGRKNRQLGRQRHAQAKKHRAV